MFKKKKTEEVEAPTVETEETGENATKTQETPKISDKALDELKELSQALNEKYAYYMTSVEASGLPDYVLKTVEISILLGIYDELRQIRKANE